MFPFMSRSEINVENMKAWALICRVKMEVMIMPDLLDERIRNYEKKKYMYMYIYVKGSSLNHYLFFCILFLNTSQFIDLLF